MRNAARSPVPEVRRGAPVGRNSSIGNSTAIRFHISSGTRQTVGTRRRLLLRPAAIHTSTPSPCDVQRCRTPWRAGDPALNHLWDRLLGTMISTPRYYDQYTVEGTTPATGVIL